MMGFVTNLKGLRTETTHEGLPVSLSAVPKRKWCNLMPVFVILVVVAEIAFLGRLDMAKDVAMFETLADLFYGPHEEAVVDDFPIDLLGGYISSESESCEVWLEREDAVTYSRNFTTEPILVVGAVQEQISCSLGCEFRSDVGSIPDGTFGLPKQAGTARIRRSMESTQYYLENNIAVARRWEGI